MLTPAAAAHQLQAPFAAEDLGLSSCPHLAIDLRGSLVLDEADDAALANSILSAPGVITGVCDDLSRSSRLAAACDVLVSESAHPRLPTVVPQDAGIDDLDALVAALEARIERSPLAAVALVELLRMSHQLPVPQALAAESFVYATLQGGPEFAHWLSTQPEQSAQAHEATSELVSAQHIGSRLMITLQDVNRHNAFSASMRDQLVPLLTAAVADSTIEEVALRGAGASFCAGGDLREFGTTPDPTTAHRIRMTRSAGALLHQLREKLTVTVHGAAIGAGIELSAFANNLEATQDAFFRLPEVEMGLIPGAGGTVSITRRIGRQRCAWLAISGTTVDIDAAMTWSLVDTRVNDYPSTGTVGADLQEDGP